MNAFSDAARTHIRTIVATLTLEIARQPPDGVLATSWAELLKELDLGPEPETRACPACRRVGLRAAAVCGYCWTKLAPDHQAAPSLPVPG